MNERYVLDEDGSTVSGECLHYCAPGSPAPCEAPHCQCACHRDPELRAIADAIERENRPSVSQLMAERYGRSR